MATKNAPRRKLIACCDGTWNQPNQPGNPTNVSKMVRAILPVDSNGCSQIVYYHPGVGTGNLVDRVMGGTMGVGLSKNVQATYGFLVDNYQDGDELFLFGFSRGAYTARSVAGFVSLVGLLQKMDMEVFPKVYDLYRRRKALRKHLAGEGSSELPSKLRRHFPKDEKNGKNEKLVSALQRARRPRIFFVGVWDTVGALGVPLGPLRWIGRSLYAFHDTELGPKIRYAYQALAIDERRWAFEPAVWVRPKDPSPDTRAHPQTVEQVWFAGAHSNVGGGYPDPGLSDIAFLWMAAKAADACDHEDDLAALALDEAYLGEKVDQTMGQLVDSRRRLWRLLPGRSRRMLTGKEGMETFERVHRSAVIRYRWGERGHFAPHPYKPKNAEAYLREPGDPAKIAEFCELETRFRKWQDARDTHPAPANDRHASSEAA